MHCRAGGREQRVRAAPGVVVPAGHDGRAAPGTPGFRARVVTLVLEHLLVRGVADRATDHGVTAVRIGLGPAKQALRARTSSRSMGCPGWLRSLAEGVR